jgi:hypothetical protein
MAIAPEKLGALAETMQREGVQRHSIIGEVRPAEGSIRVRILG